MGMLSKNIFNFNIKGGSRTRTLNELLREFVIGQGTSSGITVGSDSAMRVSAVYACRAVLGETIAQLPLITYKRENDKVKSRYKESPLYSLLHDAPNDYMDSFEFRDLLMTCLLIRDGNFCAFKNIVSGTVRELLPIHPDDVTIDFDKRLFKYKYYINGKEYGRDKIYHVKGLSTNGWKGVSPITYARESIGLALATERYGGMLFKNGARPSGALVVPGSLSPEKKEEWRKQLQENYSGDNVLRPLVLEGGLKWENISMTSEDAQFLETRKYQRSDISAFFRVPLHMINDLERATNNNIEHQSLEFVIYSLMPWMKRIEQSSWLQLLNPDEKRDCFVEFNVDGLLRGDMKSRYEAYSRGINFGFINRNEVREKENMNYADGLDNFLIPSNMTLSEMASSENGGQNAQG